MTIADRIQQLRKAKGISQEELADKIGVSRQAISKWESEQSTPELEKIILLSEYFDTTTDFLLKGIEPIAETTKLKAIVFTIIASMINAIGLMVALGIWIEYRKSYSVVLGLAIMTVGCGVFLMGQFLDTKDKSIAKLIFNIINIWILLLIPLSCCFNMLDGVLGGFYWRLTPIPMMGNSYITYGLCWLMYLVCCVCIDVTMMKRINSIKHK